MKRYWTHKLAQLTIGFQICLAPVLLGLWYLTFKSRWSRFLVVANIRILTSIINHESRYI